MKRMHLVCAPLASPFFLSFSSFVWLFLPHHPSFLLLFCCRYPWLLAFISQWTMIHNWAGVISGTPFLFPSIGFAIRPAVVNSDSIRVKKSHWNHIHSLLPVLGGRDRDKGPFVIALFFLYLKFTIIRVPFHDRRFPLTELRQRGFPNSYLLRFGIAGAPGCWPTDVVLAPERWKERFHCHKEGEGAVGHAFCKWSVRDVPPCFIWPFIFPLCFCTFLYVFMPCLWPARLSYRSALRCLCRLSSRHNLATCSGVQPINLSVVLLSNCPHSFTLFFLFTTTHELPTYGQACFSLSPFNVHYLQTRNRDTASLKLALSPK